ncbi:unnamed protein product [Alternaria alternata]
MDVPLQERSTLSDSVFVILKGERVERLISSYRSNYSLLTQAFISFNIANQNATPSKTGMRPELHLFQSSLKGWLQAYGGDDLFVIAARSNLGITLHFQGKLDEAEHSHRYVYRKRQRILGPHHHETIKSKANLAITINEQGRHSEAEAIYREAIEIFQARLGDSHPDTLKTHINLATALHDQDKFNEAESIIASALPLVRKELGDTHRETLKALEFRAILLQHMGKFLKAHGVVTELYQAREKELGRYHDDTQRSLRHMRDLAEDVEEEHAMHRFASVIPIAAC